MKNEFLDRAEILGRYITETGATVRQAAAFYGISKSTVHKDVTDRLFYINRALCNDVKHTLEKNKSERHLRGGEATRQKYLEIKSAKQ